MLSEATTRRKRKQRRHTVRRLRERYRVDITTKEYKELCRLIRSDDPTKVRCIGKYSLRLTVHACTLGDKEIFVVYDKQRKSIATVLTEAMVKDFLEKEEVDGSY